MWDVYPLSSEQVLGAVHAWVNPAKLSMMRERWRLLFREQAVALFAHGWMRSVKGFLVARRHSTAKDRRSFCARLKYAVER